MLVWTPILAVLPSCATISTSVTNNINLTFADINLTVVITNATSNATSQQINVAWNLSDPASAKCIAYYRVVYWTDNREPVDTYVTAQNFYLDREIPCSTYTIEVNAVVANPIIEGPIGHVAITAAGKGLWLSLHNHSVCNLSQFQYHPYQVYCL